MSLLTALVLGLIAAGLIWLYLYSRKRDRQRREQRAAEAARYGLQPVPVDPVLEAIGQQVYSPHGRAEPGVAGLVENEYWVRAADFTYQASRSSTAARACVFVVNLPVALPTLEVRRDNPIARGSGLRDIELESAEFNAEYWVDAADARYASAVLHPRAMELLLQHRDMEWRIEGNLLIAWRPGYWTVPLLLGTAKRLILFFELIPHFVLTDYGKPVS